VTIVELRKSGDHRDFYFVAPYHAATSPDRDVMKFDTNIRATDVVLAIDTGSSMSPSLDALKTSLASKIVPGLVAAFSSIGIAVVDEKDSDAGDPFTANVAHAITTTSTDAVAALSSLVASGGGDEPQAQEVAMDFALTGNAFATAPPIAKHTSPSGTSGGVDLRAGGLPVVVQITDAHWHDDVDVPWPSGGAFMDASRLASDFAAMHAKFVGVVDVHLASSRTTPFDLLTQPRALSDATSSHLPPSVFSATATTCPMGVGGAATTPDGPGGDCRLVYQITDGAGLDDSIVRAMQGLAVTATFDVSTVVSNDMTNPPGPDGKPLDATPLVGAMRAMSEGSPTEGCPKHATKDTDADGIDDTFVAVTAGTAVCFEIIPRENDSIAPGPIAIFLDAFIDVVGVPGSISLDHRAVTFLVPPKI
jgi:hypothetical protein